MPRCFHANTTRPLFLSQVHLTICFVCCFRWPRLWNLVPLACTGRPDWCVLVVVNMLSSGVVGFLKASLEKKLMALTAQQLFLHVPPLMMVAGFSGDTWFLREEGLQQSARSRLHAVHTCTQRSSCGLPILCAGTLCMHGALISLSWCASCQPSWLPHLGRRNQSLPRTGRIGWVEALHAP